MEEHELPPELSHPGSLPFGYAWDASAGQVIVAQDEAAVVRRIFRLHAKEWGLADIARKLNDDGGRTRHQVEPGWNSFRVSEILHRQCYAARQEEYRIVSAEEWARAQRRLLEWALGKARFGDDGGEETAQFAGEQVRGRKLEEPQEGEESLVSAKAEAEWLHEHMTASGATADDVRDLIGLSEKQAAVLERFVQAYPEEKRRVLCVLKFREAVLSAFEGLVRGEATANPLCAPMNVQTTQPATCLPA